PTRSTWSPSSSRSSSTRSAPGCGPTTCSTAQARCLLISSPRRSRCSSTGSRHARASRNNPRRPDLMTTTTDLPRPRFARMYVRAAKTAEQRGATAHRRRLLDGLRGIVLELGAGHGLNFPHYPTEVTEVIAIEPEPTLRDRAAEAAASAPVPIRVLGGVADHLPLGDESVDAAVASLVLCSVPDQDRALSELRRVLRP